MEGGDEVDAANHEDTFDGSGEGGEVERAGVVFLPPNEMSWGWIERWEPGTSEPMMSPLKGGVRVCVERRW
jgi:hypothetical protein